MRLKPIHIYMRTLFYSATFLLCSILFGSLRAQVVTIDPPFATQSDNITVTFDASQGNAALVGVNQVYAHTGVVTSASATNTSWLHVVGNWGTADATVEMTNIGNNKHQISYNINQFYNVPSGETVQRLAFVFRNADGSIVGRATDGSDIFVDLFNQSFAVSIVSPYNNPLIQNNDSVNVNVLTSSAATIDLYVNNTLINSATNATQLTDVVYANTYGPGKHYIWVEATDGTNTDRDTVYFINRPNPTVAALPAGLQKGINYTSNTTATLVLFAPFKDFVYVIGDFNNWEIDPDYYMNVTPDGETYWLELTNLTPGEEYAFQYLIDNEQMRVADVYAEKYLDPWNDQWIDAATYPNLKAYPAGKTTQPVSILQTAQTPYQWDSSINYTRPKRTDLVIYELLVRDFVSTHNYQTLIDTLDYLDNLGINAIQLMPIMEFEGNESWGYNPAFFFAPDKYYGTKDKLKEFIEECHRRDIAVILDIALNHSFGLNPMVRMYFDPTAGQYGQPTANSPWFNQTPTHDFNVGYDFNHQSPHTKEFSKRVMAHWVNEYKIDGYRFDLSKGFTQNYTLGNVGAWNAYDQSRVDLWNEYGAHIWGIDPTSFLILEHFADNSEETALANSGFMLWGNMNHEYSEGAMGYPSNFSWGDYKNRNWNSPHLISYMESHDEERLMFKNIEYGNSSGSYNVRNITTALERVECAANLFYTIPGPKMLWQFGEVGYDYSINYCPNGTINPDCRTANKPIKWDYFTDYHRNKLYNVMSELHKLKTDEPAFETTNYNLYTWDRTKRVNLWHPDMDVVAVGNFDVIQLQMDPNFSKTGKWYEYFTGDSVNVTNVNDLITLAPGEYRLYTTKRFSQPDLNLGIDKILPQQLEAMVYPNPANSSATVEYLVNNNQAVTLTLTTITGKQVATYNQAATKGLNQVQIEELKELPSGFYLIHVQGESNSTTLKLQVVK